jgi:hypothetical protein
MYRYDKQGPTTESVGWWMFIAVVSVVIVPYVLLLLVNHLHLM